MNVEQLPAKVGKYDIREQIGKGSMGVVYRGHDPFVDREVAIKVSTSTASAKGNDAEGAARRVFVNEARAAGRLDHPHILKVFEAGEDDAGQPYMVMEFVPGADTLRTYTSLDRLLPVPDAMRIIKQVAEALDYAHTHRVLHRDVKPANIMLTQDGRAKLGDFGIARRLGLDETQIQGWFGSPLYMSPEQARDESLTTQSDLFSLGAVFYELLTGSPPFVAKGLAGVIQKVTKEDARPPSALRPEIPEAVDRIVLRMLAKDLSERYRTGEDIALDLARALEELSYSGRSLTDVEKLERLGELAFFSGFSSAEMKEVVRVGVWRHFAPGEAVFRDTDNADGFFVLVKGAVEMSVDGQPVAILETGECFGEMGYLTGGRRSATILARGTVQAMHIRPPLRDWASLPCQIRIKAAFQESLIRRLQTAYRELARRG